MLCALNISTDMIRAGQWMELDCWIELFCLYHKIEMKILFLQLDVIHGIEKAALFGCCKPRDNSHGVFKTNAAS